MSDSRKGDRSHIDQDIFREESSDSVTHHYLIWVINLQTLCDSALVAEPVRHRPLHPGSGIIA